MTIPAPASLIADQPRIKTRQAAKELSGFGRILLNRLKGSGQEKTGVAPGRMAGNVSSTLNHYRQESLLPVLPFGSPMPRFGSPLTDPRKSDRVTQVIHKATTHSQSMLSTSTTANPIRVSVVGVVSLASG